MAHSLNQFGFVPGTTNYQFGYMSIPNMLITSAPADTDWARWAMLFDGSFYRLYFFKRLSNDTLYQFAFNRSTSAYEYGFNSIPVLSITGTPPGTSADSFAMLHDGANYRLYLRESGHPETLVQFAFNPASQHYEFGYMSIPRINVTHIPPQADLHRWNMLFDGSAYRLYAFAVGSNSVFYQAAFNRAVNEYQFGFNSIPVLNLINAPVNSNFNSFAMLNDRSLYRFYLQTL
ncbi:MAG: hypothetical protein JWR67_2921 [Mucilaginibacter sp.]|nr:hypothetical protein [Mucilaginibacter sp.]MDB5111807.1 hypothetical protein [Mucilaginibacter sp.]